MSYEPKDPISMWSYAVKTVREAWATEGKAEAERVAANWQRNVAFDKFKLIAAAE